MSPRPSAAKPGRTRDNGERRPARQRAGHSHHWLMHDRPLRVALRQRAILRMSPGSMSPGIRGCLTLVNTDGRGCCHRQVMATRARTGRRIARSGCSAVPGTGEGSMAYPVEICFRNVDRSAGVERRIRERAAGLHARIGELRACRVVLEPGCPISGGSPLYRASVDVIVPGADCITDREPPRNHSFGDPCAAVDDAFAAIDRLLDRWAERIGAAPGHRPG